MNEKKIQEKGKVFYLCHKLLFDYFYVYGSDGNVGRRQTEYYVLGYRKDDNLEQEGNSVFSIQSKWKSFQMISSSIEFCLFSYQENEQMKVKNFPCFFIN